MNCLNYRQDIVDRFWSKVIIPSDYENQVKQCWEWQAGKDKDGYGYFHIRTGTKYRSHRFSYEYYFGIIPDKMLICHTCDNPSCVNPYHLFAGTNTDNLQDMSAKCRGTIGAKNVNAAFVDQDIVDIIEGVSSNKYSGITEIMNIYHVSRPTIHRIFNGETWAHVTCNYPNLDQLYNQIKVFRGVKTNSKYSKYNLKIINHKNRIKI